MTTRDVLHLLAGMPVTDFMEVVADALENHTLQLARQDGPLKTLCDKDNREAFQAMAYSSQALREYLDKED